MTPSFKNIALCSDGTGNTTIKGRGTNVFKLFEAVDLNGHKSEPSLTRQIAYYDDGVGTQRVKPLKLLGGAFGWGLKRNVKELYTGLCRAYEPGDQIYLFGFSRGAYTARTLGGLIVRCGIIGREHWQGKDNPDKELRKLVNKAYRSFRKTFRRFRWLRGKLSARSGSAADKPGKAATRTFRTTYAVTDDDHAPQGKMRIRFIGVWDTVAAVGLPIKEMANFVNEVIYPFRFEDLTLDDDQVVKACHAVSIDDERKTFQPEVWDERGEANGSDRIEQVWFAGAHSNVGGGYPKQGLSLVSLDWMMTKAEEEGLRFLPDLRRDYRERRNPHDMVYDSRSGLSFYYRYQPRDIQSICEEYGIHPKIHVSVFQRLALATDGYAPGNLPNSFAVVSSYPNAPGEDPQSLEKLAETITSPKARGDGPRLVDLMAMWVMLRRRTHASFWVVSVGVLVLATIPIPVISQKVPKVPEWLASWLGEAASLVPVVGGNVSKLIDEWPLTTAALMFLLVLYLLSLAMRRRMARVFSSYWRHHLVGPWS